MWRTWFYPLLCRSFWCTWEPFPCSSIPFHSVNNCFSIAKLHFLGSPISLFSVGINSSWSRFYLQCNIQTQRLLSSWISIKECIFWPCCCVLIILLKLLQLVWRLLFPVNFCLINERNKILRDWGITTWAQSPGMPDISQRSHLAVIFKLLFFKDTREKRGKGALRRVYDPLHRQTNLNLSQAKSHCYWAFKCVFQSYTSIQHIQH